MPDETVGYATLDATSRVPTKQLGGTGADNTKFLRGDRSWQVPPAGGGGGTPSDTVVTEKAFGQSESAGGAVTYSRGDHTHGTPADPGGASATPAMQLPVAAAYPFGGAPATLTATAHAANVARVFPFEVHRPITVNAVAIRTNAALANCLILGIFNATGARIWQSGALSTVATGWVAATANLPITLQPGNYYLASTNNGVTSSTAAYAVSPAVGTAGLPRWGTVPTASGAMPASIDPTAITETVGGWMIYALLSAVTT